MWICLRFEVEWLLPLVLLPLCRSPVRFISLVVFTVKFPASCSLGSDFRSHVYIFLEGVGCGYALHPSIQVSMRVLLRFKFFLSWAHSSYNYGIVLWLPITGGCISVLRKIYDFLTTCDLMRARDLLRRLYFRLATECRMVAIGFPIIDITVSLIFWIFKRGISRVTKSLILIFPFSSRNSPPFLTSLFPAAFSCDGNMIFVISAKMRPRPYFFRFF